MKKTLKIAGITLFVLLAAALIVPLVFRDRILQKVKTEINNNLTAKVEFSDLSLSLFAHFPKLTIELQDISVANTGAFAGDTLLTAKSVAASVNLLSLFRDEPLKIAGVYLESPRIRALVNKDGRANWEITKEDTTSVADTAAAASSFAMQLNHYRINNGYIYYNDESSNMSAEISEMEHTGSGDFTESVFTLYTSTKAVSASFTYENIPYLINARSGINADFQIDNNTSRYSFKNADMQVNNLKLLADGWFQIVNDTTYGMDIAFKAPSNDFKDILSLVPAIYKTDFDKLKTSGTAAFHGFVKGNYSTNAMPAYKVNLDVKDGFFQYPDLPAPVKNIQVTMQIDNPDGITDHTVVDITKGHLEMGAEPFDFRLLFKNPETAQYIDAAIKGKLNLSEVSKFIKLEEGTKLSGQLMADAFARGSLSALQQQEGAFNAGGLLQVSNLYYASKDFPKPVQHVNLRMEMENKGGTADGTVINITQGHAEIGKDPVDFTLQLSNPVSSMDFKGTAKGSFTLDEVKQFVTLDKGTELRGVLSADMNFSGSKAAVDKKEYDKINLDGTMALSRMHYVSKDYPDGVSISKVQLTFNPQNIALNHMQGIFQNTSFSADGVLQNLLGYALQGEELQGTVNVAADKINLNKWMGTEAATSADTAATASEPFLVPAKIDFTVHAKAGEVLYDKVQYNNIRGTLVVKDETVKLQDIETEALGGSIAFNGSYGTRANKKKPAISMSYDIRNVDVQQAFFAYNTVQKIMPVGRFLAGRLSSQMSMTGSLGGDMMPDFSSLTGNGNLLLIEGVLSKFEPVEKLASTLQISDLKEISMKDLKSHFEFSNGKVLVKPFDFKVKDMDLQVGGMHGFDQSIDYIIAMKVPRSYLGSQGNALINNMATQAVNKGIPVSLGEVVDLNVRMGGSITAPVLKTDLRQAAGDASKELKQQAVAYVQQKTDSARQVVKDSLTVVKKQVVNDVKDELAKQLIGTKDSTGAARPLENTKKKAEETIKNTLGGFLNKKKKGE
jgi:uncharacterized protein involved in outer membrane biogenesis